MRTIYTDSGNFFQRVFSSHGNILPLFFLSVASFLTALILTLTGGSIISALLILVIATVIIITCYRIDWGFFLFVGAVLAFDQFPPRGYDTTIIGVEYFENLKAFNLFSSIDAAVATPMELHLFFLIFVWILLISLGKKVYLQKVDFWFLAFLFFLWLVLAAMYGVGKGGDFLPALWELRALFYLGILYFFVPQIIQSKEQIYQLMWVIIAAISFKVFIGIVRVLGIGFDFGYRTELTNHEDPLFFGSLFIFLFCLILYHVKNKQKSFLLLTMVPTIVVFIFAQRRITYGAFGVANIVLMTLLPWEKKKILLRVILPVLVVFGLYLGIFWDNAGVIGLPAQLVKSAFSSDQKNAGERYYSNLYREFENFNLSQTIKRSPLIGIGFGNKYDQPLSLVDIPFSLRDYIPHNEIFWLIVKMGMVGFLLFWLFFDLLVTHAASLFTKMDDPYLKAMCATIVVAITGQVIVSYYDLQLTYNRNMVYLGVLIGLLPTLKALSGKSPATEQIYLGNS